MITITTINFRAPIHQAVKRLTNVVKSRSREIGCYNDRIALKFDRHLNSVAAELPVKFQGDWKSIIPNLAASKLREILVNKRPITVPF